MPRLTLRSMEAQASPMPDRIRMHRLRKRVAGALVLLVSLGVGSGARATIERCTGPLNNDVCAEQTGTCPAVAQVGLATSDWPVYQHDVQHTGKSTKAGPTCASPSALWSTRTTGRIESAPVVGPAGQSGQGILYVPSAHHPISALDPSDGHILWDQTNDLGKDVGYSSPVIGNGDSLYVGTRDNDLWAIELPQPPMNPATVEWREKVCTDGDVVTPPVISAEGLVYMGSDSLSSGSLFAMCPGSTRQVKWCHNPVGGSVTNVSPALSPDGSRLYITFQGSWLVSYDASTGEEKWRVQVEQILDNGRLNQTPVVHPVTGRIYLGFDTGLFAVDTHVDPMTHEESPVVSLLYPTLDTDDMRIQSPPALDVANNTIYFGATRKRRSTVYAVTMNGQLKWKRENLVGRFLNNPPAIDANGRVYVAMKRVLHALDPASGADLWTFSTSNLFLSSPVVAPGRIYLGNKAGTMYAIGCGA